MVGSPPLVLEVYPDHTNISYRKGADYIKCDVEIIKDLKLICSHEAWINEFVVLKITLNFLTGLDLTTLMMTIQISIGMTKK